MKFVYIIFEVCKVRVVWIVESLMFWVRFFIIKIVVFGWLCKGFVMVWYLLVVLLEINVVVESDNLFGIFISIVFVYGIWIRLFNLLFYFVFELGVKLYVEKGGIERYVFVCLCW